MDLVRMALKLGAKAAGTTTIKNLVDHQSVDPDILPSAKTAVVIACGHSRAALESENLQVKQNDALATYEKVRTICKELAMTLEGRGFKAVAIPAFLPIDISDGKEGMVGPMDLRRAAVEAGVGRYGKSGLILVEGYGPRVRLGAVLTSASLKPTKKKPKAPCPYECKICLYGCPGKALLGEGKVDKKACGRVIFQFGLRGMMKFVGEMANASPEGRAQMLRSYSFRELWQTLVSGNYYYCFECQALCPIGKEGKGKR